MEQKSAKSQENETVEQLMLLKSVTLRTGAIHEAQVLQLKAWPLLMDGVLKSVARVDVDNKRVVFNMTTTDLFNNSELSKKMLAEIDRWTKILLWDETRVMFKSNKKIVYDSWKVK